MDRPTFLRNMLGKAALLTLPPWAMLPKPEQDRLAWTQNCHGVFVFSAFVRGFQYHDGPQLIKRMQAACKALAHDGARHRYIRPHVLEQCI